MRAPHLSHPLSSPDPRGGLSPQWSRDRQCPPTRGRTGRQPDEAQEIGRAVLTPPSSMLRWPLWPLLFRPMDPPFRRLWFNRSNQAFTKPLREVLVIRFTTGDAGNRVRDRVVVFDELITAPPGHQLDQIERCPLVAVRKAMVADNAVDQCLRLLMNTSVIAVMRASNRRLSRVLVYDPRDSAILKRFLRAADRIRPGDAVVWPTDLPAPSWPFDASRRSS